MGVQDQGTKVTEASHRMCPPGGTYRTSWLKGKFFTERSFHVGSQNHGDNGDNLRNWTFDLSPINNSTEPVAFLWWLLFLSIYFYIFLCMKKATSGRNVGSKNAIKA